MSLLGLSLDFGKTGHEPVHLPHCIHMLKSNFLMAANSSMVILRRHSISERVAHMFRVFIRCSPCLKIKRKSHFRVLRNPVELLGRTNQT